MKTDCLPAPPHLIGSELKFEDKWISSEIRDLINRKTIQDYKPNFLFLGDHEALLLRYHLGCAFGPENVCTLKNLYYMGLEVVELDVPQFLRTAGYKRIQPFIDKKGRIPEWKDIRKGNVWRNVDEFGEIIR